MSTHKKNIKKMEQALLKLQQIKDKSETKNENITTTVRPNRA